MVVGVWSGDAAANEVSERSTGLIVPCIGFTTGIPPGTGDRPVPVPATGLYPHRGYGFGHGYQVWYPYPYPWRVYPWGTSREGGPR